MNFITSIFSAFFKNEEDRKRLYKTVLPSFIIHFFAAILALGLVFIMTRGLGSKQYGIFSYSFSVVAIIVNLATYGICMLVVKETPAALSKGKIGLSKGLHLWTIKWTVLLCTAFALIAAAFIALTTFFFHFRKETVYTIPLLLALISMPLSGLMNYYTAALRGQHKSVLSLLPDNIVKPTLFLFSIGILYFLTKQFNVQNAVLVNAISFGGGTLFAILAFYKIAPLKDIQPEYDIDLWKKTLKSLFLLQVIMSINSKIDILMLGYLKDSSAVGIFSVADMVASKLLLFLQIMVVITVASISRLHTLGEKQKLQEMITKVSRWVFLITIPVYIFIIVFRRLIMSYFGLDFESGQIALIIISTGQIINVAFGPIGIFALMTGNQKFNIIFTIINIVLNISLNLLLTPTMGINGTAIATAVSLVTWNTSMFIAIRKKTGIKTWIFG